MPPAWCDAHHIHHWADGGLTKLFNLILLCRRHHRLLHEGRLTVNLLHLNEERTAVLARRLREELTPG